jgi:hypothetical protein
VGVFEGVCVYNNAECHISLVFKCVGESELVCVCV